MSLDMQKLSPHLQEVLLNLKHMSPMQRFAEVSRPRYELNWRTIAGAYGVEKLEKNQWIIPDCEVLGGTYGVPDTKSAERLPESPELPKLPIETKSSPLICTDDTDQNRRRNGVAGAGLSYGGRLQEAGVLSQAASIEPRVEAGVEPKVAAEVEPKRQAKVETKLEPGAEAKVEATVTARIQPAREKKSDAAPLTKEEEDRLNSGVDHEYSEAEPDIARERQRSIELAARVKATPYHSNNNREVLRDEELMEPEVRAEVEALGGMEALPVNEDYVLARDGQVMHRITLQHALEKSIRQKLGVPEPWRKDEEKIRWHKEQLARLEKADAAPRCEHIYMDGTRCRAPRLKQEQWCYAHERMLAVRAKKLRLLAMEDANSIVVNLMEIGRALCDDEISERKAGLLMYQQQLALIALKGVTFKGTDGTLMVRELPKSKNPTPLKRGGTEEAEERQVATDERRRTQIKNQSEGLPAEEAESAKKKPNGKANNYHGGAETRSKTKPFASDDGRRTQMKTPPRAAALHNQEKNPGVPARPAKSAPSGDPGVESAKSNRFGVEGGGGGGSQVSQIAVIARDRRHPARSPGDEQR